MECNASKDHAMEAIDKQKNCNIFAVINLAALFLAMLYCRNGDYPFTFLVIAAVTLTCAWNSYKKGKFYETQVTDVNDGFIKLEEEYFSCSQAAENYTYEECEIRLNEIEKIIEDTKAGKCGFFIQVAAEPEYSNIYVNNKNVVRNLFYVNGLNYDRGDFKNLYQELRNQVPGHVQVAGTLKQKSWDIIPEKEEFIRSASPVIFIYMAAAIHLLLYLAGK